ncbi:Anion exchange protein 3 [Mactra antiquata]
MSYNKKSDFGVIDNDVDNDFGPNSTIESEAYTDDDLPRSPSVASDGSQASKGRQVRSASISVATEPTSTGLSFVLDMDKEETLEQSYSLHDDIEKMFEKTEMTLNELLSSGGETLPSNRGHETEIPIASDRFSTEYDISSHRRSSFPHIHVPLKSLHSHSLKNFATLIHEDEEKPTKKKKKKKSGSGKSKRQKKQKTIIYPSKSALLSPAIPEVEKEEYSESVDTSSSSEEDGIELPNDRDDEPTEKTKLLIDIDDEDDDDKVDGGGKVELFISEDQEKPSDDRKTPPAQIKAENSHLQVPWVIGDSEKSDSSFKKPGLFYIGNLSSQATYESGSDLHDKLHHPESASSAVSLSSSAANFPHVSDSAPVVVVLDDDDKPMVSTSIGEATKHTAVHVLDNKHEDNFQVKFLLGEDNESEADLHHKIDFHNDDSDDSDDDRNDDEHHALSELSQCESEGHIRSEDDENGPWQLSEETKVSHRPRKHKHKHRKHHHHKEHYGSQDLMRRRQRGSEVQISDALKRVPTEIEEADTLQSADLDDMASHRMDNLEGFHHHKIGRSKKHKPSKMVYEGKSAKPRRKYFKPQVKTFDHSPHEVFVELDELYTLDNYEVEWREKARWIKFEEDVEEGAERWGKPHVASLSFHSLLELRKGLENGSLMLDLEVNDLIGLAHRVVEDMVIHDQIPSEVKGQVMRTLLTKHKFLSADTVKSLIRRNKSSVDLLNLEQRHRKDPQSLMKTFSQASFSQNASTTNLNAAQNSTRRNSMYQSNNSINHHSRSHSIPSESYHSTKVSINDDINGENNVREKKSKKKKKTDSVGDPGKLEFVKVDVDNNMATADGVHIGLIPKEEESKDQKSDQKMSLMKRIPHDAEACSVLVGCVDYLEKPAMAFVRLAEKQVLDNLTEVPLPVRFIFILLGPEEASMDYHEVGRSISTLMSNQHFHEITYKAESRSEILHAINEFLNESIVLPPGDWDQKTLLPIMDMSRKRAKLRRKKQKKLEELEELITREKVHKIPMDPLKRTGRPFGGLINDIRRRYPYYISDFKDALNPQCIMALIFIFFACLCPCIAFGGLYGEKTYGKIGLVETIFATSITNLIFGLFSGQPLILYGATGPVLVFEKHLFAFCKSSHIDFLTWRVWIGLWVFIITLIVLALEGSFIVKYITRFVEEVFAILISLIFINEVVQKLIEIYKEHPLREKHFYCDSLNIDRSYNDSIDNITKTIASISAATVGPIAQSLVQTTLSGSSSEEDDNGNHGNVETYSKTDDYSHGKGHYSENMNEPNTALLSTILIFGTFLIAYFLRIFRNSRFLGRSARRALGDFGIFTAIVCMVLFDYICAGTYTQKLYIPSTFTHSDGTISRWFVNPLGEKEPLQIWLMFVAAIPAFLIFLLLFLESQLTQMLLHKEEFKLKKGSGFHLDQFILGITTFMCSLFGLPWMCPATVRSVAHVSALAVMSRTHAPGEKPKLLEVRDQRVTNIVMNILIGSSLAWGSVLRAVPIAVLFGVFLYLGVSAISGVQLFKRFKLLLMPVKHHPGKSYVRRVRTIKMHAFTVLQLVLVALLWIVKSTVVAIAFPLFVFLMVPLRLKILPRFFTHDELEVLDKEEEDSEDEEDIDPDFYQMAHMPI